MYVAVNIIHSPDWIDNIHKKQDLAQWAVHRFMKCWLSCNLIFTS